MRSGQDAAPEGGPRFARTCAAAAGFDLRDPGIGVDERGMQHLVLIDRRAAVVARFPRTPAGCALIGDAAARLRFLHGHGLPVPQVLGVREDGGPGTAHLLQRYLPGAPLDEIDTDALPGPARARLVADLVRVTARLHRTPIRGWPSPGQDWVMLWRGLVDRIAACPDLDDEVRRHQLGLARAAAEIAAGARIGIFHGDLGGVNCRVDPSTGAVLGLLDWDSAMVGDVATDLAAVLAGVGPGTAAQLRAASPRWEDAAARYPVYVRTWPVQAYLWSRERGTAQQLADAAEALMAPAAGPPR